MGVLVWIRVVNRSYNIIIIYIGINLVILYIILKSGVSFVLIFWSCREYKVEEREEKKYYNFKLYICVFYFWCLNKLENLIYRWMFIYLYLICDFYYMDVNGYYFFVCIKFLYNL